MKFIPISLILSMLISVCLAQTSAPPIDYVPISSVGPEAASIGKFGNIPVGLSTGIPGVSIPIDVVKVGNTSFPVNLAYHAGGVRVDEVASCVGMGWALDGYGIISRNVVGLPDELYQHGYINSPEATDVALSGGTTSTLYKQYVFDVHQGLSEAEPDIFQFNFNGQSGKFIFRHDSTLMQIPVTNNKIIYTGTGFNIIDANGAQYIFDLSLTTTNAGDNTTYPTQWQLTKIVDANTVDTIFFSYESTCNTSYEQFATVTQSFGMTGGTCGFEEINGQFFSTFSSGFGPESKTYYQNISHYDTYLKEIKWRGGKISFVNICGRQDVTGSGERLDEVDIYSENNGTYTQTKRIKLYQGDFFSNPLINTTPNEKFYRLRLDSVAILPIGTSDQPVTYRMIYDTTAMAPRESQIMDRWGFNNGKFTAGGGMEKQFAVYNGVYYSFGSANRDADSSYSLACTLKSIQYPTKGKTVFEYEPHRYKTNFSKREEKNTYLYVTGGVQQSLTGTFTVSANSYGYTCTPYISATNTNQGFSGSPTITIKDQATNQLVFNHVETPAGSGSAGTPYQPGPQALTLIPGHTYVISINIYTNSSQVNANVIVNWIDSLPNVPEVRFGGGLRVKKISNYDLNGKFLSRQLYEYGDSGEGIVLTPQYFQNINFEKAIQRVGCHGGGLEAFCVDEIETNPTINPVGYSMIYYSNPVYPITQFAGSPVLYRKVTAYNVDSIGTPNGKTISYFQVYQDGSTLSNNGIGDQLPSEYFVNGVYLISNNWKNGFQTGEDIYKYVSGNYMLQKRKRISYLSTMESQQNILKIKPQYRSSGCEEYSSFAVSSYAVPITTGAMVPIIQNDTLNDDFGYQLGTSVTTAYNSNLLPVSRQMIKSNGDSSVELLLYPNDLSTTGNVYEKMVSRNIVTPVIKIRKLLNGTQISAVTKNYVDFSGNSKLLVPSTLEIQNSVYPSEVRARYNQYDGYGNILQQQKDSDSYQSVILDYRSTLPVAIASNAAVSDIAYSSFEADGAGNWTGIINANIVSAATVTGSKCYTLTTAGLTKTGLISATTYIVSYWSKGGAYTAAGTAPVKTGPSVVRGGVTWTYYEHQVSGVTSIKVAGSGGIDELRLYPSIAQMETYTYAPGIGMTSKTNARDLTSYYEYDGLGRLKLIRDKDNNIIQTLQYHFVQ
ncbi:hypothetical protein [Chitinophaga sp.]|uniref:hypothetical protein n=1 Tax=Chitinophaga sp. TaxID=1869181 RepID=UPI0031E40376